MKPNKTLALQLACAALGMVMLAFASVPLYRLFCQITGFGGTTKNAMLTPYHGPKRDAVVTVNFDTNTDAKLPWEFRALERSVNVHIGENKLVAFKAKNLASQPTRGTATYNVTPFAAAKYFSKVQCFCFNEQQLAPHQSANFPVSFFIDPAILDDPETRGITNITLSYTFFSYESANKSKL